MSTEAAKGNIRTRRSISSLQNKGKDARVLQTGVGLEKGHTPSTISTTRSRFTEPGTFSIMSPSLSLSLGTSAEVEKNTHEILTQWRLERDQQRLEQQEEQDKKIDSLQGGRNKLGDRMGFENSQNNSSSVSSRPTKSNNNSKSSEANAALASVPAGISANSTTFREKEKLSRFAPPDGKSRDDHCLDAIVQNHDNFKHRHRHQHEIQEPSDSNLSNALSNNIENANTNGVSESQTGKKNIGATAQIHTKLQQQLKDGNSIMTTPTTNTALNAMGIDRMCNRKSVGMGEVGDGNSEDNVGASSLNVRLFRPMSMSRSILENEHERVDLQQSHTNGTDNTNGHTDLGKGVGVNAAPLSPNKTRENSMDRSNRHNRNKDDGDSDDRNRDRDGDEVHVQHEDVSLITQDTGLQNIIEAIAIEHEDRFEHSNTYSIINDSLKANHNDSNRNGNGQGYSNGNLSINHNRQSMSTMHSKGIQEALSSLHSSLERSRSIRKEQDQELIQCKHRIERLEKQNASLVSNREQDITTFSNCVTELFGDVQKICTILNENISSVNGIRKIPQHLDSIQDIVDAVKVLGSCSLPTLLDFIEQRKAIGNNAKKDLEQCNEQLTKVKSEISRQERQWQEKQKALSEHLDLKKEEFDDIQNQVEKKLAELDDSKLLLQRNRNDLEMIDKELTNVRLQQAEKQLEFDEVNRLCDARIKSAHSLECKAQMNLEDSDMKTMEANSLHHAAMKKRDAINADERAICIKREELESDRIAWETQLQLKSDQLDHDARALQEREEDIASMSASLESRKSDFETDYNRIKAVQNGLLDKEYQITNAETLLLQKQITIDLETKRLEAKEVAIEDARLENEKHASEFKATQAASLKDIELQELNLRSQQNEFDEDRDQYSSRLCALEESETQMKKDCQQLSERITRFKKTVKMAKVESEKKKYELKEREAKILKKEISLSKHSKRLFEDNREFEKVKELCIAKGTELMIIDRNCKEKEESLEKLKNEMTNIRCELEVASESLDIKQKETKILKNEERLIRESIVTSERARDDVVQAIRVKETLLRKFEQNIAQEQSLWEKRIADERSKIVAEKEQSKEKAQKYYADAQAKMMHNSKTIQSTHDAVKKDLDAKAKQLEALHSQLLKMQQKIDVDNEIVSKREGDLQNKEVLLRELSEKLDVAKEERLQLHRGKNTLLNELEKHKSEIQLLQSKMVECERIKVQNIKLEQNIALKDQALQQYKILTEKEHESLLSEKNKIIMTLREKTAELESMKQTVRIKDNVVDRLQDSLRDNESTLLSLDHSAKECELLRLDKKKFQNRLVELESEAKIFTERNHALLKRERELDFEQERFTERLKAVEEAEMRLATLDEKEKKITNEYEALTEFANLIEEEKKDSNERLKELGQRENDFNLRRDSLTIEETDALEEKTRIETDKRSIQEKSKKLKKLENELNAKLSNVAMSEKKLKEYAKLMKKQTKEVKEKEESLENLAKILNDKKAEMSSYSVTVSELEDMLEDEHQRYQDLHQRYGKLQEEKEKYASDMILLQSRSENETIEDRIQQMALRIKKKDEELTRKQLVLEDKLAKCDECETRLATWQSELESVAAAIHK